MKKEIHPTYYPEAKITCACGNTFSIGSTVKDIQVEICSACHPFFTGKQKLIDTSRRVDKFQKRVEAKEKAAGDRIGRKAKRAKQKKIQAAKKVTVKKEEQK